MANYTQALETVSGRLSSGSYSYNFVGSYTYNISWSVTSTDIARRTSKIHVTVTLSHPQMYLRAITVNWKVGTETGQITQPAISSSGSGTTTVGSFDATIQHNSSGYADGVLIQIETASWNYTSSLYGSIGIITPRKNFNLTAIPVKSTMTFPQFTIGSAGTITVSRASSSFSHKITYSVGSTSGTVTTKTTTTSISWTPPTSLYKEMYGRNSVTGTFTLTTYNGEVDLGSTNYSFTLKTPGGIIYNPPNISNLQYERGSGNSSSTWSPDPNGSMAKISFNLTYVSISGNTTTIMGFLDSTQIFSTTTLKSSYVYYTNVGTTTTHTFKVVVSDTFGSSMTSLLTITTLGVPFNLNFELPGIGIGKIAESSKVLEIANDWAIHAETYGFNVVASSVLSYAESCEPGLHLFITNANSTDVPSAAYLYSTGLVYKRSSSQIDVFLKCYNKNLFAMNTYLNSSWLGWSETPDIQKGKKLVSSTANTNVSFTIDFPRAFASTPIVMLNLSTSYPNANHVSCRSITTTSCTGYLYSDSSTNYYVDWVAFS